MSRVPIPPQIKVADAYMPVWESDEWRSCYPRGGRWSGKSRVAADYTLVSMRRRSTKHLLLRQFQNSIDQSNFSLMTRLIRQYEWEPYFKILKTTIVSRETGSVCLFIGMHLNVEKVRSFDNVGLIWFEQAEKAEAADLREVLPTLRPEDGSPVKELYTWNPLDADSYIEHKRQNRADADVSIFTTWHDNPFLPDAFYTDRARIRREEPHMESHILGGQYRPLHGAIFHAEELQPISEWSTTRRCRAWDVASSESETADRTVGALYGKFEQGRIIEDVKFGRWEVAKRNRIMRETAIQDECLQIVEVTGGTNASAKAVKRMFGEVFEGMKWRAVTPAAKTKIDRADPFASMVNAGNVYYPESAPWVVDLRQELAAFPEGPHDDMIDALAYAEAEMSRRPLVISSR